MKDNLIYPLLVAIISSIFLEYFISPLGNVFKFFDDNPEVVVEKYFNELNKGHESEAYNLYYSEYKDRPNSKKRFDEISKKWDSGVIKYIELKKNISSTKFAVVSLQTIISNQEWNGNFYLIKEDGNWKIYQNALKLSK